MKSKVVLICSATLSEMDACLKGHGINFDSLPKHGELTWARDWTLHKRQYCLAITGVGMPLTIARLLLLVAECWPALILNLGIAGAYIGSGLKIGDVVAGETECFGDLGMETPGPEAFIPLSKMAWADAIYKNPLALDLGPWMVPEGGLDKHLRVGRGCTVNACSGTEETGAMRSRLFACDFESMEGAGVALVARLLNVPAAELRGISNLATTRDMRSENVDLALRNLGVYMKKWLDGGA